MREIGASTYAHLNVPSENSISFYKIIYLVDISISIINNVNVNLVRPTIGDKSTTRCGMGKLVRTDRMKQKTMKGKEIKNEGSKNRQNRIFVRHVSCVISVTRCCN